MYQSDKYFKFYQLQKKIGQDVSTQMKQWQFQTELFQNQHTAVLRQGFYK